MIVTVNDVDAGKCQPDKFHRGAIKEDPAVGLVSEIPAGMRVDIQAVAIEEAVVADKDSLYGRTGKRAGMHVVGKFFPAEVDTRRAGNRVRVKAEFLEVDGAMARN